MNILKDKTKSICPICYIEIDAQVLERDGGVHLLKECPVHGKFDILIERDPSLYKRLMNKDFPMTREPFNNLSISLTHLCNLNCNICCLPKRDDYEFPLEEVKRMVSSFNGQNVRLTGGEPTLREDLPQMIKYIVDSGKTPTLVTNGIKLTNFRYLKKLRQAGLKWIHFSFNGFSDKVYENINGRKLLQTKLRILKNLKRLKINTVLSIMLVKGVNEGELKKVYRYCLNNNSFIKELRIRASTPVGRFPEAEWFCLSDLVKIFSDIIGISEDKLVKHSLDKGIQYSGYHVPCMPYHLAIDIFSLLMDEIREAMVTNSILNKARVISWLFSRVGIKNTIKMIIRKLNKDKRLFDMSVKIRARPDKYRIDLGEMQRCPSAYVTRKDKTMLPFCYAVILNEKYDIL